MKRNNGNEYQEIEVKGTLVRLHKRLNQKDLDKCEVSARRNGMKMITSPTIIIDFLSVTSIQEDFRDGGTIIMDAKTACLVREPLEDVLEAWCKVKEYLGQ